MKCIMLCKPNDYNIYLCKHFLVYRTVYYAMYLPYVNMIVLCFLYSSLIYYL